MLQSDLGILAFANPALTYEGSQLIISYVIFNNGPSPSTNTTVTGFLPPEVRLRSAADVCGTETRPSAALGIVALGLHRKQ